MQARESTLALKPREDIIRSPKQGCQWPHKKDLCPTKILKKQTKKVIKTQCIVKQCRSLGIFLSFLMKHKATLWTHFSNVY